MGELRARVPPERPAARSWLEGASGIVALTEAVHVGGHVMGSLVVDHHDRGGEPDQSDGR
jgi:hypothetical protein